ncbi:Ig-like domain-containing protein [Candidatus Gracilibacteria bacterium]|nr:Ig-like domain-containing protein [Candidatus Gracilibacteria bacterium]
MVKSSTNSVNEGGQVKFGQIAKGFDELYKNRKALVSAAVFTVMSTGAIAQAEIKIPQNVLEEIGNMLKKPQGTQMSLGTLNGDFLLKKVGENEVNIYKGDNLVYVVGEKKEEENKNNIEEVSSPKKNKSSLRQAGEGFLIDITSNASVRVGNSGMYGPTASFGYASEITKNSAIALEIEGGENLQRFLTTIGFSFGNGVLMFSGEHLGVRSKFQFSSGEVEQMVRQNSFGTAFKMHFNEKILKSLEVSGYITKAQSYELSNKEYTINNDTLFAIYNNYRNIAGGEKKGIQGKMNFKISEKGELILGLNYETLTHDLKYSTDNNKSQIGGVIGYNHKFSKSLTGKVELRTGVSSTSIGGELSKKLSNGTIVGITARHTQGRNGTLDDNYVGVTLKIPLGQRSNSLNNNSAIESIKNNVKQGNFDNTHKEVSRIVGDVKAQNNSFKNYTTIHRVDQKSERILEIQKGNLDEGVSILNNMGDLVVDGVEVSAISSISKNGSTFNNTGAFQIQSKKLVIVTRNLIAPAKGNVDNYEVSLVKINGGKALVSLEVKSGSIIISKVSIEDLSAIIKDNLIETIKQARIIDSANYTPNSYSILKNSLKLAVEVFNNEISTQEEVDTATNDLKKSIEQLVKIADFSKLKDKLIEAQNISKNGSGKYTAESIISLNQAIILAQTTLNNLNSTQKEVNEALDILNQAITKLVTLVVDSITNIQPPVVLSVTTNSINVANSISDADGIKDIKYFLYSDAGGTAQIQISTTGQFVGLNPNTTYYIRTSVLALNKSNNTWEVKISGLTSAATSNIIVPVLPTSSFGSGSVTKLTTDGTFTNTFTTNSPGAVTYSSSNTAVATVNASTGVVTIVGAGSATITANQAASPGFTSDTDTYSLTVNAVVGPVLPTSSFGSGSVTKLTTDGTFTNTFTTNSPGAVTYSSSNTAVATVNASTGVVTIVGVGSATITANQAASPGFTSDTDTYSLTVNAPAIDNTIPTINSFNITSNTPTNNPVVSLSLSGSDNVGITGWIVKENNSTTPSVGDTWLASAPTSFTLSGNQGERYLYVWARDAAGNISSVSSQTVFYDNVKPTLRAGSPVYTVNGNSVTVEVIFDGMIGPNESGSHGNFVPSGWSDVSNNSFKKTYSSNTTESVSFPDAAGNYSDPVNINITQIDNTAPTITSGSNLGNTNINTLFNKTITFSEGVTISSVSGDLASFDETTLPGSQVTSWVVSGTPTTTGTKTLNFTITDNAGNNSVVSVSINVVAPDNIPPNLTSSSINVPSNANGSGTLNFSENVTLSGLSLVKASDGTLIGGGVSVASGSGTPDITLSVTTPNMPGEYVKIIGTATDEAGNSASFESSAWSL